MHVGLQKLVVARREVLSEGIVRSGRIASYIGFTEPLASQVDLLVDDFEVISRNANDAFNVMRVVLKRKLENDDIAAANFTVGQDMIVPVATSSEDKFVDQKMVAHQKRGFHGLGRNLEGLHDKRCAEQRQDHRAEQGLNVFAQRSGAGFFPIPRGVPHVRDLCGVIHDLCSLPSSSAHNCWSAATAAAFSGSFFVLSGPAGACLSVGSSSARKGFFGGGAASF